MLKSITTIIAGALLTLWAQPNADAHCQVPCGIYDEDARIHGMEEDIATIEKAVQKIVELSGKADPQSQNQRVRWINAKEAHAEKIMRTVSDYFLAQKIKGPAGKGGAKAYYEKLARHHAVLRAAMKCKQTVSGDAVSALKAAVAGISEFWVSHKH